MAANGMAVPIKSNAFGNVTNASWEPIAGSRPEAKTNGKIANPASIATLEFKEAILKTDRGKLMRSGK